MGATTRINPHDAMREFPHAMSRLLQQVVDEDPALEAFSQDGLLSQLAEQGACFGLRGTEAGIVFVAWQKDEPTRVVMYDEQSREWVAFKTYSTNGNTD